MKGLVKHIILFFIDLHQLFHFKLVTPKVELIIYYGILVFFNFNRNSI